MDYSKCWLTYHPIDGIEGKELLGCVSVMTEGTIINNGVNELKNGLKGILGMDLHVEKIQNSSALSAGIVIGLLEGELADRIPSHCDLTTEGYAIITLENQIFITGLTEAGILYGIFDFLRRVQLGENLRQLSVTENPRMNYRTLNHWDNMDSSIERGYAGNSFFFKAEQVIVNERTVDYARLMASVGINAVTINNVNVREKASYLITDEYLEKLVKIYDIFSGYGIRLFLSINFASPIELGGLPVSDPLDENVCAWWSRTAKKIYTYMPNFGGFLVKADSEFQPGPFAYGRDHADGANMLARAVAPFGGIIIWRCFVYNCTQNWRDKKIDRARAAYDNFIGLDGRFDDNVILQVKSGPMDFQIREPISPLLGRLEKTNQIMEVQIAQEYTGQQKHVCFLVPMWKEALDFNTYACDKNTPVKEILSGQAFNQTNCGMAAVSNTGDDFNWTGHDLAAANLYGYGRLAWNPSLSARQIGEEWIDLTFTGDAQVKDVILDILMDSRDTYEKYTSPLGIGWMVNPSHHYGPNIEGYEYDNWGTYHRADCRGIGVDRTPEGTGYTRQYQEQNAAMYESMENCPEELLLFFHRVQYDHKLKSGKTLIQHIYDTHFEGVELVEEMIEKWNSLKGKIPEDVFERVSERFDMQMESAIEWRDRINTYFHRISGVEDNLGRKIY